MSVNEIIQLISNIGFPIACAIALFIAWQKDRETTLQTLDKMRESIDANTNVISQLLGYFRGKE
jgi:hypothetical protein